MQGVTPVSIIEVYVDILLQQQFDDVELVLPRGNKERIAREIIRQVAVGIGLAH